MTTLNRVGAIAKKLGITWGGTWAGNIDRPHFEIKFNWQMPVGYKLGQVIVPSNSKMQVQLIVEDKPKEEVKVPEIKNWNPGSPAMQTATENIIKWGVEKKHIQSQHLTALQNKELTTDRVLGLVATVIDRGGMLK